MTDIQNHPSKADLEARLTLLRQWQDFAEPDRADRLEKSIRGIERQLELHRRHEAEATRRKQGD